MILYLAVEYASLAVLLSGIAIALVRIGAAIIDAQHNIDG